MLQTLGKSSEDVLAEPIPGGRSLTTKERQSIDLSSSIRGWGSDLDPSNRPGVPMDKAPHVGIETLYPAFEQQVPRGRVHKSTEHGKLTPVFGNVCPPRGLSGKIRDFAYNFSEGRALHWTLLVAADRVDMFEQLFLDVARLRIPNIPGEMGIRSALKHNRKRVLMKTAIFGLVAVGLVVFSSMRRRKSPRG